MSEGDVREDEAERFLEADTEPERVRGVHLLRDRVEPRERAARRLVDVLADPGRYVPHAARAALQTLGADALPALLDGLASPDASVRTGCCWALAQPQGARAEDVAEALARLAGDPEPDVRDAVAGALGRVGGAPRRRAERLAGLARDREPRVRVEALRSLGLSLGLEPGVEPGGAGTGRAALVHALDDGQTAVRLAAAEALLASASEGVDEALRARVREVLRDEPEGPVIAPLRALLEAPAADGAP